MEDRERESLISQARSKALEILEKGLQNDEEAYNAESNSMVLGSAIKAIKSEMPGLDSDDYESIVLSAYFELSNDLECSVFSKATEFLHTAYNAGVEAGFEFGYESAKEDFESDFETYMTHIHKSESDVGSVVEGFIEWWMSDDDSSSS